MATAVPSTATKDNFVRIGDHISLKFPKIATYLSAEGILSDDVFVSPSITQFEDHLFQIYVQRQYSATNELEEFLDANSLQDTNVTLNDPSLSSHMEALVRGKDNESVLNRTVMKSKVGNVVCFGDTIQLLHVKSNKFVTIRPTDLARDERENMKVTLSFDGSVMSWIKIMPRFKIDREGEPLTNGTEVLLKISERSTEFLHCADRAPPRGKFREVNSSMESPTGWKISLFHKAEDINNSVNLLAGQLVCIRDPESFCALAPMAKPISFYVPLEHTHNLRDSSVFQSPIHIESMMGMHSNLEEEKSLDEGSTEDMNEFIMENGGVVLRPMSGDNVDSDAIWMIESKFIYKAGPIKHQSDRVHLRHLNTGKYLAIVQPDEEIERYQCHLVDEPHEKKTLFHVMELHSALEFLRNGKAVQIKHGFYGTYLQRGHHDDHYRVYTCSTTRSKGKAINLIIQRYDQKDVHSSSSLSKAAAVEESTLDIFFGRATMYHIDKFVRATAQIAVRHDLTSIWPRIDNIDRAMFAVIIARALLFVRGFPIQLTRVTDDMMEEDSLSNSGKFTILRRQHMFREQGLLQALMIMIKHLQIVSDLVNSDHGGRTSRSPFVENGKSVLSQCLNLLYYLIHRNSSNQLYIADHMLIIFGHVSTDKMAAKIAQELLSSNRELQETKIGIREITIFTEKMREVHMNSMYIHLLRTCCSCLDEALPRHQEIVNQVLYHKCVDVLIQTTENGAVTFTTDWGKETKAFELFLSTKAQSRTVKGLSLFQKGIPEITLQWDTKSSRYSSLQLFRKSAVPLSEVMMATTATSASKSFRPSSNAGNSEDIRRAVADFYIAQLQLTGEMCLGRNYPIIVDMEKLYSYELLLSILKSSNCEKLQGSAAYLMLHLYVDRDPQSRVHVPRLTRILADVTSTHFSEFVCVGSPDGDQFALLQIVLAHHLDSIRGKPFPMHTFDMLGLLHALVQFNFYGNKSILYETVEALHGCLVRGAFDLVSAQSEPENGGLSANVLKMSVTSPTSRKAVKSRESRYAVDATNGTASEGLPDVSEQNISDTKPLLDDGLYPQRRCNPSIEWLYTIVDGLDSFYALTFHMLVALVSAGATLYIYMQDDRNFICEAVDNIAMLLMLVQTVFHYSLRLFLRPDKLQFVGEWQRIVEIVTIVWYAAAYLRPASTVFGLFRLARLGMIVNYIYYVYTHFIAPPSKESSGDDGSNWSTSTRHLKTNMYTLKTLQRIVEVLNSIQKNIEDRRLSLFLRKFEAWTATSVVQSDTVTLIFQKVMEESSDLAVSGDVKDDTLIDLLMYPSPALVQTALNLLMTHHSSRRIFLEYVNRLQMITTPEVESTYFRLESIVLQIKREVDTHEIWGRLDTEEYRKINDKIFSCLAELTNSCKQWRDTLKFDESHEPIKYIQNILRNLGCFEVCMRVSKLILHLDLDNGHSESAINTRKLALAGNQLLYWLILDNPANQSLAYAELKFFIKTIDSKIDSDRVITSIFRNNIELMELVPKKYIAEFVDMICGSGKFPQYLALMSSIISVGEKNVIGNQIAVIKLMSSPDNQKKIVQYFVPISHPDYQRKIRLMSSYLSVKDIGVEELPSELAYHLELMKLLSSCTIGRSGMTTIEAKVQSMFHFVDVIDAMLDPNCLLLAKIRLGQYLYNAVIDVETPVPAVKDAAAIWQLLVAAQDVFAFAKDELRQIEKNGWSAPTSCRQKIEFMLVNAMIVESYFSSCFDRTIFKPEIGQTAAGVERMSLREQQGDEIIRSLFSKIRSIYELLSPLLQAEHHSTLYRALCALNAAAKEKIVSNVDNIHASFLQSAEEYKNDNAGKLGRAFEEFLAALNKSKEAQDYVDAEIQQMISKLDQLPWKAHAIHAAVAFEPLLEKLVTHVRGCIKIIVYGDESMKFMESQETHTSIWILKILRTMIENRWGMTIYERDDDGGEEQDDAVVDLMRVYNECGVIEMCLDLIAKGLDIALQSEALKLLVGMLFKEGGALELQKTIHVHLSRAGSDMFFRTVRQILHNLMAWHHWNGVIVIEGDDDPQLPDEIIIVRCLQLMCEGHFGPNQDIMREQPNNNVSINLLDDFVLYLQCLDHVKCRTSTTAELAVSATVLEVIQGPCEGNQDYFALNTELIETLNRKLRQHPVNDCDAQQELELKKSCIDIFQALLEGQGHKTAVYERMLSVIHVDVIMVLCTGESELHVDVPNKDSTADEGTGEPTKNDESPKESKGDEEEEESEEAEQLRTESLVLLQMLVDFRPTLKEELGLEKSFDELGGDSVACIEVVWRGELQRRFFSIPDICRGLAKSTKDAFIETVKRSTPEDKLYGLLQASEVMYREVMHQQLLKSYQVDFLFSKTTIDRMVWLNFYLTFIINLLFVIFYVTRQVTCGESHSFNDGYLEYFYQSTPGVSYCSVIKLDEDSSTVSMAIFILNLALIAGVSFTLLSTIVVRAPVKFQALTESGISIWRSVLITGLDFSVLYYASYLAVAVVGLFYHPALSVLLLDFISLSRSAQDVLKAVYNPRKQIFMTLVLTFILMYIFTVWIFFFINGDKTYTMLPTYVTLGNLYKYMIRYGLPFGSTENQTNFTISSPRVVSDILFFMTCLIMMNILKGITIDTFVELRKELEERTRDTTEVCFMCGIEKNTFNRTLDRTAFRIHITQDQNLWNYLYFIMYLWQQDKDDDDGLESYVRRCIDSQDLIWFPMNKAIRLAEHQEKGDVHSLRYRFRKDAERSDETLGLHLSGFKDQLSRTIGRVEKALEYETDENAASGRRSRAMSRQISVAGSVSSRGNSVPTTPSHLLTALDCDGFMDSSRSLAKTILTKEGSTGSIGSLVRQRSVNFAMPTSQVPSTVMDADNSGQMHIKVAFIDGMMLDPSYLKYISVRIITEFQTTTTFPLTDVQLLSPPPETVKGEGFTTKSVEKMASALRNTKSSFTLSPQMLTKQQSWSLVEDSDDYIRKVQLRFDTMHTNPTLTHQGLLPKYDLSKIMIKVQVLFDTDLENRPSTAQGNMISTNTLDGSGKAVYLGGARIPLINLIARAHEGALLEAPFRQKSTEVVIHQDNGNPITLRFPDSPNCVMGITPIASYKLLQDFSILKS